MYENSFYVKHSSSLENENTPMSLPVATKTFILRFENFYIFLIEIFTSDFKFAKLFMIHLFYRHKFIVL